MSKDAPWASGGETPQKRGRRLETPMAKEYGARVHPGSGAGKIKEDASSEETLIQFKTTDAKGYRITPAELEPLLTRSLQQGKEPLFVIDFLAYGLRVEIVPKRIDPRRRK